MNPSPEISFVIVNYNGIVHTRELLMSMEKNLRALSYEIIVVDNGSFLDEGILLSNEFPHHSIIRSEKNLGFSGGNNIGIKASIGKYIMMINNDTILIDDSVNKLSAMLETDKSIVAVSPKIHFMNPPGVIQFAGYTKLTKITLRNRSIGYNEYDKGQYDTPSETFSLHGAAMMIKRDVLSTIGFMPEIYFLYYEELEWSTKMREYGYKLMYQPSALVIHKESQSTGNDSYLKRYYMTRNRLLFASRNRNGIIRLFSISFQLFVSIPKSVIISIINGRSDIALATIKGAADYFRLNKKDAN